MKTKILNKSDDFRLTTFSIFSAQIGLFLFTGICITLLFYTMDTIVIKEMPVTPFSSSRTIIHKQAQDGFFTIAEK